MIIYGLMMLMIMQSKVFEKVNLKTFKDIDPVGESLLAYYLYLGLNMVQN
jgi:hypothetical protein